MLPGDQRGRVTRVDGEVAWVRRRGQTGRTVPVPARSPTVRPDSSEDDFVIAELANQVAEQSYTWGGYLVLRHYRNVFFLWNQGAYREHPDCDVAARVMEFLRSEHPEQATPRTQAAVLANLKAGDVCHVPSQACVPCWLDGDTFEPASEIIPLHNGCLDLAAVRTGATAADAFSPASPALFATTGLPVDFDAAATCPQWDEFLIEIQPDPVMRELLQEIAGYTLLAGVCFQRFFLFLGPGMNGKGVFTTVIMGVLGSDNCCSIPLSRFGERFALWPLTTRLLNSVAELPATDSRATSLTVAEDKLKAVVAGDPIEVERKRKDVAMAKPTAKLVFSCNELPRFVDRSNGVWRRLIIAPFDQVIADSKEDTELAGKILRSEGAGIINWMLEGAIRLLHRGQFVEPEASKALKRQHRTSCDHETEFLLEHCRAGGPDDFVPTDGAYKGYRTWVQAGGYSAVGRNRFSQAIKRAFPKAKGARRKVDVEAWPELALKSKSRGYLGIQYYLAGVPDEENDEDRSE